MRPGPGSFYVSGGTLRYDAPCYVERQADKALVEGLLEGEFCYVLTSRQMGKSSLMVHAAQRLRAAGCKVVAIDLSALGQNLTAEQWYGGMLITLGRQLDLEDELEEFWLIEDHLGPVHRFCTAMRQVLLNTRIQRLVIFVDEIDTVRSLPFATAEFFGAIRECYNRRHLESEGGQVSYCLLGVATPAELIADPRTTPFNVGRRIELDDFTLPEALALAQGLPAAEATAESVLRRVVYWTHGHPYLTQRLCQALLEQKDLSGPADVDRACEELFLAPRARERDDNLLFVRERLLRSEADLTSLLRLYDRVRAGQAVPDDEHNPLVDALRLAGIVRTVNRRLRVRNLIYHRVFDRGWVQANLPVSSRRASKSVAVLPFANLNGDRETEYLSDGITEDLITALSQVGGLWVPSRTSVFTFKGRAVELDRVRDQLEVNTVLQGTVRTRSGQLRVTAQLVRVADGSTVWAETYDRELRDVFTVMDELTRGIVDVLKVRLVGPREERLVRAPTSSTEAYQLYLKGRFFWNQRGLGLKKAVHYFELALCEDPSYALAYSGLADAYGLLGFYGYVSNLEAFPKARAAALKALAFDEALAEAHASLAFVLFIHDWDFAGAEAEFKRALALNPNYSPARYWYASCLSTQGRMEEALAEDQRAIDQDPLSVFARTQLGWLMFRSRRYHVAIYHLHQALELEPQFLVAHWLLGQAHLFLGRHQEALSEFRQAIEISGGNAWMRAWLGYALAVTGDQAEARRLLAELEQQRQHEYVRPFLFALVYAGLEEADPVFEWLEKALEEREEWLPWLHIDAAFDRVRADPRFAQLITRIGIRK